MTSNNSHLCIPCAITNVAGYWTTHGYSGFGATDAQLESKAVAVQNYMKANGTGSGATANVNIQLGFDVFKYTSGGYSYSLERYAYSQGNFSWTNVLTEINAGRPFLLGFSGGAGSPYGPHMTVCVGYEIYNDKCYAAVSDAHVPYYRLHEFSPSGYNDNMFTVSVNRFVCLR